MRARDVAVGLVAVVGVTALVRMQRETRRVRRGTLRGVGPATTLEDAPPDDPVHRMVREWRPTAPRHPLGRLAALVWAAPMTAIGAAAVLAGGRLPRWDPEHLALVATDVRGPARWFLRQQGATAATLGHVVVARAAVPSATLLAHEALHARQQERLGLLFALAYPLAGARWGYRQNPFEVAARAAAEVSGPAAST